MPNTPRKSGKIGIEQGSGNVFADLDLDESDELYTRAALGAQVVHIIKKRRYTQKEAARRLGVKQPEISALLHARFHRFSQERLMGFLNRLNRKVTIQVSKRRSGERFQEIGVVTY